MENQYSVGKRRYNISIFNRSFSDIKSLQNNGMEVVISQKTIGGEQMRFLLVLLIFWPIAVGFVAGPKEYTKEERISPFILGGYKPPR
jgi:hypothetical protein